MDLDEGDSSVDVDADDVNIMSRPVDRAPYRQALNRALFVQLVAYHLTLDVILLLVPHLAPSVFGASANQSAWWTSLFPGIPLAQISLLAIWVGRGRSAGHWRFAVAVPAVFALWRMVAYFAVDLQAAAPVDWAACWLLAVGLQFSLTLTGLWLAGVLRSRSAGPKLQFGVTAIFWWMVAAGTGIGILQHGWPVTDWSVDFLGSPALPRLALLGLFNALMAVCLTATRGWQRPGLAGLIGMCGTGLILLGEWLVLEGASLGLHPVFLTSYHLVVLLPSLWLVPHQFGDG